MPAYSPANRCYLIREYMLADTHLDATLNYPGSTAGCNAAAHELPANRWPEVQIEG